MRKNKVRNIILGLVILIALISSIRVEKLDVAREKAMMGAFDARAYAENFWKEDLMPHLNEAIEINYLKSILSKNPEQAFEDYSKALGIGNIRFFMVRGEGEVIKVGEDDLTLLISADGTKNTVNMETEYIFGNAVRDASGKIDLQDFEQTMDFNNVSAEINQIIREKVLPQLKENAQIGTTISFVGAIEMNMKQVDPSDLQIIPVKVEFLEVGLRSEHAGS